MEGLLKNSEGLDGAGYETKHGCRTRTCSVSLCQQVKIAPTSSIRKFWQRLDDCVHPDDLLVLNSHQHTFNLDFPPPAFIGDVDNAPIVILMANGGYDPVRTPTEFLDEADRLAYLRWLRGESAQIPDRLSPYYTEQAVFAWIRKGIAVMVNAVAYRSPSFTSEPQNGRLAKLLPSLRMHKQWLRGEVLPAVASGRRLVIAHRSALWDFPAREGMHLPNVYHSTCPASPYLSKETVNHVKSWLQRNDYSEV